VIATGTAHSIDLTALKWIALAMRSQIAAGTPSGVKRAVAE